MVNMIKTFFKICTNQLSKLSFSLDRFCNGKLSCMAKSTENHGVLSSVLPFEIFVVFTKTGDTATIDRGFALEYTQNSC